MKQEYEIKNGELVWCGINAIDIECAQRVTDIAGQKGISCWHKKTMVYLPKKLSLYHWRKLWDIAKGVEMHY